MEDKLEISKRTMIIKPITFYKDVVKVLKNVLDVVERKENEND